MAKGNTLMLAPSSAAILSVIMNNCGFHFLRTARPSASSSSVSYCGISCYHRATFSKSQAWERWVSKNANDVKPYDRSDMLQKKLAYAPTSELFG